MNKERSKANELAVSPVVGVMLMLVVTIIIAAVVSAFSGSMTEGKEKAPQASLECHITWGDTMYTGNPGPVFSMKHMGGDPINTKNVKLVTSWANNTGEYNVASTIAPIWGTSLERYSTNLAPGTSHYTLESLNTHYTGTNWTTGVSHTMYYNAPYLVIPNKLPTGSGNPDADTPLWFGNYVFKAGDMIKADNDNTVFGNANFQNQAKPVIKNGHLLTGNEIVNVKLIDLKSGTTIFNRDIIVEV